MLPCWLEMHTTGPQRLTGCSSQQSKLISDSAQSSTLHTPRGKKRERSEHIGNQSKRDQSSRLDDKINRKHEYTTKGDAFDFITNKDGGLMELTQVDRLILLMRQDHFEASGRSFDLSSQRIKLVSIIAATEKEDYWRQYIQLGGLSILDDWLQAGHKGNSREADKNEEELILVILNTLDKLPINLEALKACTIGKTVNQLRNHRNQEIQKKARKLVDIWKKRVEVEMKLKDEANGEVGEDPSHDRKNLVVDKFPNNSTKTVDDTETTKSPTSLNTSLHLISSVHSTDISQKEEFSMLELNGSQDPLPLNENPITYLCLDSEEHNKGSKNCTLDTSESSDTAVKGNFLVDSCLQEAKESKKCRVDKDETTQSHLTSHCLVEICSSDISVFDETAHTGSIDDDNLPMPDNSLSDLPLLLENNAISQVDKLDRDVSVEDIVKVETGIEKVDYPNPKAGVATEVVQVHCIDSSHTDYANQGGPSKYGAGDYDAANNACNKQVNGGEMTEASTDKKVEDIPTVFQEDNHNSTSPCHYADIGKVKDCQELSIEEDTEIGRPKMSLMPSEPGFSNDAVSESKNIIQERITDACRCDASDSEIGKTTNLDSQPSVLVLTGHVLDETESVIEKSYCNAPLVEKTANMGRESMRYSSCQSEARDSKHSQTSSCQDTPADEKTLDVVRTGDNKTSEMEPIIGSVENCAYATKVSTDICSMVAEISKPENVDAPSEPCSNMDGFILSEQPKKDKCHDFDLNEGLLIDDFPNDDIFVSTPSAICITAGAAVSYSVTAPIAVVAATKGGYFPPVCSIQNTGDVGWKGSAATSAFRPAEPRYASGKTLANADIIPSQSTTELPKPVRNVLDFDLNISNESLEGEGISSENDAYKIHSDRRERLSLDLNCIDEEKECVMADAHCATGITLQRKQTNHSRPDIYDLNLNDCPLEDPMHAAILPQLISENAGMFNSSFVGGLGFSSAYPGFQGVSFPGLSVTRIDPSFSAGTTEPGFRQASLSSRPSMSPSAPAVYPTVPAFIGTSFPFLPNVSVNSLSFTPGASPYSATSSTVGTVPISLASFQNPGAREAMPVLTPPAVMNARELGESGNGYTWGRQDMDLHMSANSRSMANMEFGMSNREPSVYPGSSWRSK